MSKSELASIIADCCNDVVFDYNGKKSGITSEVKDHVPTFQAWHGEDTREYDNVDEVMNDKFYSGKSINDLLNDVEFTFV